MNTIFIVNPQSQYRCNSVLGVVMAPVDKGPLYINNTPYLIQRSETHQNQFVVYYSNKYK